MKIGIIGDTHFGAGYNLGKLDQATQLNSRLLDYSKTFDNIINSFIKNKVELIVLTGDIFETRQPTSAQLNAFSKCIKRAIDKKLEVVIVVGNHDQQRTISTSTVDIFNSLNTPGISVYSKFNIHRINKDTSLLLMPYRDRRMIGSDTNQIAIDSIKNNINELCKKTKGTIIGVGHFMVGRSVSGENPDSFSINELILPFNTFTGLDAVIMGHVHKQEVLSKNPLIMYSGSMEKNSFGEKHHEKKSIILDTSDIKKIKLINNNVRNFYEINLDYSDENNPFKDKITEKIIEDIEVFCKKNIVAKSIMKFSAKIKENDLYFLNQDKIKECILNKKIKYLSSIQVSAANFRKLRNKNITENINSKFAMKSFINSLKESQIMKNKLIKLANSVISEVEGK